jgi:hypothetical protein
VDPEHHRCSPSLAAACGGDQQTFSVTTVFAAVHGAELAVVASSELCTGARAPNATLRVSCHGCGRAARGCAARRSVAPVGNPRQTWSRSGDESDTSRSRCCVVVGSLFGGGGGSYPPRRRVTRLRSRGEREDAHGRHRNWFTMTGTGSRRGWELSGHQWCVQARGPLRSASSASAPRMPGQRVADSTPGSGTGRDAQEAEMVLPYSRFRTHTPSRTSCPDTHSHVSSRPAFELYEIIVRDQMPLGRGCRSPRISRTAKVPWLSRFPRRMRSTRKIRPGYSLAPRSGSIARSVPSGTCKRASCTRCRSSWDTDSPCTARAIGEPDRRGPARTS